MTYKGHIWLLNAIILSLFIANLTAKEDSKNIGKKVEVLRKTTGTPNYSVLNINDFVIWLRQDGQMNHAPSQVAGGYYPRGTTTAIYEDNFVWGGVVYTDAAMTIKAYSPHGPDAGGVRIGGGTYNQGTVEGAIIGTGATAVSEATTNADVHIYRIRRDYQSMTDQEITRDAADINRVSETVVTASMKNAVMAQYDTDWKNWPVGKGAPYIERNGIPGYQAPPLFSATFTVDSLITQQKDEPGIAGADPNSPADQVIWSVYNDLNKTAVAGFEGSLPIGLELQRTVWGYKSSSEIGSLYFTRLKMINKGGGFVDTLNRGQLWLDSMFVCQWVDPDIGDYTDDLAGCDVALSLGYAYNGQDVDVEYSKFDLVPPAIGYILLAGPVVTSPGESAIINLKRIQNKLNLPLTSFFNKWSGSDISDPPFSAEGGQQWWRWLRGYIPNFTGMPLRQYPFPPGVSPNAFPFSGDPITFDGFVDGLGTYYSQVSGDRRFGLNTGPFKFAAGDTQEIYIATVAGLGADRYSSISKMKYNARTVQQIFNNLFVVPKNPVPPPVNYIELDENVVFEWGSDTARVMQIEEAVSPAGDFRFEGYRIYQLSSYDAKLSDGIKIFDVDMRNNFGGNTGIVRYFKFDKDYLNKIDKLYDGQKYYCAITSYAMSHLSGFTPRLLESSPVVFSVTPQKPKIGTKVGSAAGDKIQVTRMATKAQGPISVKVIDPSKLTGDTYEIQIAAFDTVNVQIGSLVKRTGNHVFRLFNLTQNKVTLNWNNNYGINDMNPIIDGFQFGFDVAPYYRYGAEITSTTIPSNTVLSSAGSAFNGGVIVVGYDFRGSSIPSWDVTKSVEIRFNITSTQLAYAFKRTTSTDSAVYRGMYPQPFTVWDISDPTNEKQIDFMFLEQSTSAFYDGVWAPGLSINDREYFYIMDKGYSGGNNFPSLTANVTSEGSFIPTSPCLYAGWLIRENQNSPAYQNGEVLRIEASIPTTSASRWQFSTAPYKISYDATQAKADVDKINVWPNPYYASNSRDPYPRQQLVTFNGLPTRATIRIFDLAGRLLRVLEKNDQSQFYTWDLMNSNNIRVASGMYIVHIEMPDAGGSKATKVLKIAVIQEEGAPPY